jgi:hypothetical protein
MIFIRLVDLFRSNYRESKEVALYYFQDTARFLKMAEEKIVSKVGKKSCRNWNMCENEHCQYQHPEWCQYGRECYYLIVKGKCNNRHTRGDIFCKHGFYCQNKDCPYFHPKDENECRWGKFCNKFGCPRVHPISRVLDCRWGDKCNDKENCRFRHPIPTENDEPTKIIGVGHNVNQEAKPAIVPESKPAIVQESKPAIVQESEVDDCEDGGDCEDDSYQTSYIQLMVERMLPSLTGNITQESGSFSTDSIKKDEKRSLIELHIQIESGACMYNYSFKKIPYEDSDCRAEVVGKYFQTD